MTSATTDQEIVGWRYEPIVAKTAVIHHGPRGVRAPHQMALPAKYKRPLLPFSRFAADGTTEPARCNTGRYLLSPLDQVGHLDEPHETPHPECECGYRIVASLTQLATYMRRQERQLRGRPDLRITHLVPGGIYQVRAVGPVLSSGAAFDDPPGSVRAAGLQMTGLVFLPENGIGRAARRALARFDLPMDVRMVSSVLALRDAEVHEPAHP